MVMAYQTVDEDLFEFYWPVPWQKFLIMVDAHSKWPEVLEMSTMSAENTNEVLIFVFATHDL